MHRNLKSFVAAAIMAGLVSDAARARQATTGEEAEPPVYELKLVYIFETPEPEFVFVVGNSGFKTVASLENFIASRPPGTTIRWSPGCIRLGGEPLLSSESEMEEFKAFCLDHRINFVLVPSG
ncbi:MAG TPA: hypothetical protein VGQ75_08080 [Thermoanaerobaculia bacterium]|nr:hypothetical protein [Thermoanaerobaculia bacterium]